MSTNPPIPPQLDTDNRPAPLPPRATGEGYLTCDFCECKLTQRGEVYQMSEKSKSMRDQKEEFAKSLSQRDEEIARLHADITAKDAEIASLKGSASSRKKFLDGV